MVRGLHLNRWFLSAASPILVFLLSCGSADQSTQAPTVRIDHVIVAVGDLQTGMDRFEELTGVRPVFGGEHPGRGTRNALVALGPRRYLELLAPQEGVEAIPDAPGLSDLPGLTGWGWAAGTNDLDSALARLQAGGYLASDPAPGSRATPDGGLLEWRTGGVDELMMLGGPFLIEWAPDSPHPATTSPPGCELLSLKIYTPDGEQLASFLGLLGLAEEVEAIQGPEVGYEITLSCPEGEVTFP
jgi:hypothetical protein